ncbi:MAG: hypothetical protein HQK88_00635 [Nitrospirae bacterium]|nr:hypothetical protein [Nitrospirota bacterium]MBF0535219.1 hypothetical protein [Nitrospirota bacterium]MBF0615301.1 hypothetical protein [Nitrospirota bacterium]
MRKLITYTMMAILITVVISISTGNKSEAGSATYYMPYLHTNAGNVVYCVIGNVSSNALTGTFSTMTTETGTATQTAGTSFSIAANTTQMITFSGTTITTGSSTITISDVTSGSYSGKLSFTGTATSTNVACTDIPMSCFQGTTNPKRNLAGHTCDDGTSTLAY